MLVDSATLVTQGPTFCKCVSHYQGWKALLQLFLSVPSLTGFGLASADCSAHARQQTLQLQLNHRHSRAAGPLCQQLAA